MTEKISGEDQQITSSTIDCPLSSSEDDPRRNFVLAKKPNGNYYRYSNLEQVPAELASSTVTYDDIQSMRKEDIEALVAIIAGVSHKVYRTQGAALDSLLFRIGQMRVEFVGEPAPKGEVRSPAKKSRSTERAVPGTTRAPSLFELCAPPKELGTVIQHLAPQAATIVKALTRAAEKKGGNLKFTDVEISTVLNDPTVREQLATRQEPERIFQYYRKKLISLGFLKTGTV